MKKAYGRKKQDFVLKPISGKAIPVRRGEVLRILQEEDGGQCVDFNAFSLHDYKEYMDVSITRAIVGFRPTIGQVIFSNPPRFRPMLGLLDASPSCVTDILGKTCHGTLFEAVLGFDAHTNCQDTIAESIAEYGLTPDDVHHSLNFWMQTEWDSTGAWRNTGPNPGMKGDYVDALALFDIVAVPVTCGSGDVYPTSNYSFKPIRVQVFGSSKETRDLVEKTSDRLGKYKNQKTVYEFRVKKIRTQRELTPIPGFKPKFVNYPITTTAVPVGFSPKEYDVIKKLVGFGIGIDEADVVRRIFFEWYLTHRGKPRSWLRLPL